MIFILVTYLAGALTILSPCILPVLPFVFSKAQQSFLKSGLPLLAGLCASFSLISALALVGGEWVGSLNEAGRTVALVLMTAFGLSLLFPQISDKFFTPLTRIGGRIGVDSKADSVAGSFMIGISTGLLWAPCAGPILGLVLTGAASQGNIGLSIALLVAYSLGAATSLAIALFAGARVFARMKKLLGFDHYVKKGLGVAVLLGVLVIALGLDRTFLTRISKVETSALENRLLALSGEGSKTAAEGPLPEFPSDSPWFNSKPLSKAELAGRVVLIDFWTYSCINCLRTLPHVKSWAAKYASAGLVVIGVHTPEFAFERSLENVEKALNDFGVTYPVVVDNSYKTWNAFQNRYWPAHYFIDRKGQIRHHHFGEGEYDQSERIIRDLLEEDGATVKAAVSEVKAEGVTASSRLDEVGSPETYLGYRRAENFASSPSLLQDSAVDYKSPVTLALNHWSLDGKWQISDEKSALQAMNGRLRFRFRARDLHLVLGSSAGKVKFKVTIDGQAPGEDHGTDIDAAGFGEIDAHRLYQLIRQKGAAEKIFEIEFLAPGAEAYAFTFG